MNARYWLGLLTCVIVPSAWAQMPPKMLPPSLAGPRTPLNTKPRDPEQERQDAIKALREDIQTFETGTVQVKRIDGRWVVATNKGVLRDFGSDRAAAEELGRLLTDLRVNQIGTIVGARPALEYWLVDGKAPKPLLDRRIVMPISNQLIHAENVGGAWVLTDGARAFYDFGPNEEAAKQAAVVFWKYGFNQLGVLGSPTPTLLYPLNDPTQAARNPKRTTFVSSPLQVADDVTKSSLLLPGNVYGGPRLPLDPKKLEIVKRDFEYFLVQGNETWARFGTTEYQGRALLKLLQDAKVDEVVKLGEMGLPIFFAHGQALRARPLGVTSVSIRTERLKLQQLRDTWWLFEDTRPIYDCGTKKDAEILLLTMQQYGLDTMSLFGRPDGGLRLFSKAR